MALQPFFSLSASNPSMNTYDPANPDAPHCWAGLQQFGGVALQYAYWRLADQLSNDELIMGYNAVPLDDTDLSSGGHPFKSCNTRIYISAHNVSTENQFLLVSQLRAIQGNPTAQFFIGASLVDTAELAGIEQHALLLDCPSGPYAGIDVYIRLASPIWTAAMGFQGIDCYLL